MSLDQTQNTNTNTNVWFPPSDDVFYAVIERLKNQKALSRDSFIREMPFFNLSSISKEAQIKELYQDVNDPNMYRSLIKNIISTPEERTPELIAQRLCALQVMSFSQIVLYKVLPCPEKNCSNRPREVATHNQYKDYEYDCPFYHHEKDRRRFVITSNIDDEFLYKANYFEEGKRTCPNAGEKDKCSLNYFESMFHPLYYKMFKCKREYCNFAQFCPFFHSEEEKKTWDKIFSNFVRKDRISYVKDKQKYFENNNARNLKNANNTGNSPTTPKVRRTNYENEQERLPTVYISKTPNPNNFRPLPNRKQITPGFQRNDFLKSPATPSTTSTTGSWRSNKISNTARKLEAEIQTVGLRKDSGDSSEGVTSPASCGLFNSKSLMTAGLC